MNEWVESPLGEISEISSGGTPSRTDTSYWNGNVPWVTPTDITNCKTNYLSETTDSITTKGLASSSSKLLPEGALLLTSRATIGEVKVATKPVSTNQGFKNLVPKGVDGTFLFYQCQMLKAKFLQFAAGSTFLEINKRDTARVMVPHPVLPELQEKIARVLLTTDQAIEKTEALIEKYQQIKAGLMHDLCTCGIGADGKLRPPREQAPELYKQTPIGWAPREWDISPLRAKAKTGVPHLRTGLFGSSLKGEHWVQDGTPVITIGALGEGEFDVSELLFVGDLDAKRLYDFQMKIGDVVFSRVADVGRSVVIGEEQVGWIMSSNLMRISLDQCMVLPDYLQYQLSFDSRIKKQIRRKVNSGGRDVANSEILNSLLFLWPEKGEQDEIVKRARAISQRIDVERQKLKKLEKQKSGLMHDLLTGKVQVSIDQADPAHAI